MYETFSIVAPGPTLTLEGTEVGLSEMSRLAPAPKIVRSLATSITSYM